MNSGTSDFLSASRWVAAFLVVLFHVYNLSFTSHQVGPPNLLFRGVHFIGGFGHMAVIVFFVISGFLVGGRAIINLQDKGFNVIDYFVNRFSRIYAVFIPALIIGGIFDFVGIKIFNASEIYTHPDAFYGNPFGNNIAKHLNLGIFVGNLMQLQTIMVSSFGSNGPLWSLANEWWYYVLFGSCMVAYCPGPMITRVVACGAIVVLAMLLPFTISLWFIVWGIGVGLAVLDRYWAGWPFFVGATILAIGLIVVRVADTWPMYRGMTTGVAVDFTMDLTVALGYSAALVCAKNLKRPLKFGSLHRLLASFSYTAYLVHFPAMVLVAAVLKDVFDIGFSRQQSAATLVYAGTLVAIIYGYAWLFAVFTEAHTNVVRSHLKLVISALLHHNNILAHATSSSEASDGPTLRPDVRHQHH